MSKKPQDEIRLPRGWWGRFVRFMKKKWGFQRVAEIEHHCATSLRTFYRAKNATHMTADRFELLVDSSGCDSAEDLLAVLKGTVPSGEAKILDSSRTKENKKRKATTGSMRSVSLKTKFTTPQWADFRELPLNDERLQNAYCQISTASPYFRFGFKLLARDGKLFGDGSIQSQDTNLVFHIGRNNHSQEVFLTTYKNGVREAFDKVIFKTESNFMVATLSVSIDNLNQLLFKVKGACCYECIIPREICYRAVMLAWGDQSDYVVDVSNISFTSIS